MDWHRHSHSSSSSSSTAELVSEAGGNYVGLRQPQIDDNKVVGEWAGDEDKRDDLILTISSDDSVELFLRTETESASVFVDATQQQEESNAPAVSDEV